MKKINLFFSLVFSFLLIGQSPLFALAPNTSIQSKLQQQHFQATRDILFSTKRDRDLNDIKIQHGQSLSKTLPRNGKILDIGGGAGVGAEEIFELTKSKVTVFEAKKLNGIEEPQAFVYLDGIEAAVRQEYFMVKERLGFEPPLSAIRNTISMDIAEGKINEELKKSIRWVFGESVEELPPEWTDQFDFVLVTRVLEYVFDPLKAIEEIYRVLKPGGKASIALNIYSEREYAALKSRGEEREYHGLSTKGLNIFKEIKRLKRLGFDIDIFINDSQQILPVTKEYIQKFLTNSRGIGEEDFLSLFVIKIKKRAPTSKTNRLKFNSRAIAAPDIFERVFQRLTPLDISA